MKKLMYYVLVLGALAAFSLTGCSSGDDDDGGGSNSLPASSGTNELSGKTVFRDNNKKIEFSVSASGAGTYTLREIKEDENGDEMYITLGGKYLWIEMATGSYTWNETGEQVYLKPDRVRDEDDGEYSDWLTRNQLIDYWKVHYPGEAESVYTTEADRMFAVETTDYIEASDGTFLLSGGLPANRGGNELSGKNLPAETWGNSSAGSISFTASGYTYTPSSGNGHSGLYAYDSTRTETWYNGSNPSHTFEGKLIYFKMREYQGKDMKTYYESLPVGSAGHYESISEAAAASTTHTFNNDADALYKLDKVHCHSSMAW